MDQDNDNLLTKLAVRLINLESEKTIGSGIIYWHPSLQNRIYILTAAHCLFADSDSFQQPLEEIGLEFYNPKKDIYKRILHNVNHRLVRPEIDNDVAILFLKKDIIEEITGELTAVNVVTDRIHHSEFVAKGFPSATAGKEIVAITPSWSQELPESGQFQLHINQDFSDEFSSQYRVDGFSGAAIFLYDHQQVYLYGIFTRFLDAGKLIYCQPLTKFETLLSINYLPSFSYTFFGSHGITSDFFDNNAGRSLAELGPRFNTRLNFQLPIAGYFNALSKDNSFRQKLTKIVDKQLSAAVYGAGETEIKAIHAAYDEINHAIKEWYEAISWRGDDQITVDELLEKINCFEETAEQKQSELYEKRFELAEGQDRKRNYSREAFSSEISHLSNMLTNLSNFKKELDNSYLPLSNHPVLIIKGNAGAGKSHLLGDILEKRNAKGFPTLLLLGQLFVNGKSLWENILHQLGLLCTQQEFLSTLNSIGEQVGTRVLLMVDAINEGAGKTLWHDGLAGFIHDCKRFPSIGLVLSVRTTYWKKLIPESVKADMNITIVDHQGFRGSEYEAVKLFCEFYGIQQPNFPLMNPEYSNPLFLHLICQGIQGSVEKVFPQGYQGITKVFGFYIKALEERLAKKREDYEYIPNLVRNSLNTFANACFAKERKLLSLSEAVELFNTEYPRYPNLMGDLIDESVLIRSLEDNYRWYPDGDDEEIIYFAYERFGDFYTANKLIADVENREQVMVSLQKEGTLGKLMANGGFENYGILETLAVLLPERFGVEIFEAFQWVFSEEASFHGNSISDWYLNSLKWRTPDSIDNDKFQEWVENTDQFVVGDHEYFNFLYEMCAVEGHPFNSDHMARIFMEHTMPERDSFIQQYFYYYNGTDDHGLAWPINRLIDWAWKANISAETSKESAKLVSQALIWMLGCTDNALRDQTTKAMVNLLKDQTNALVEIFNKFIGIDDKYIAERICAVAYGCALRAKTREDLQMIAQIVYDKIFRDGNPPEHLLLRDYCRHLVEFAISREINLDLTGGNFTPPYNSILPEQYPTTDEVKVYEEGKDMRDEKGHAARANGRIIHSVLVWDFGRYTIDSAIRNFECIEFRFEEEIAKFRAELPKGGKARLQNLKRIFKLYSVPTEKRARLGFENEEQLKWYWSEVDELWGKFEGDLLKILDEQQKKFYHDRLLPYWKLQIKDKNDSELNINRAEIKNWIVKRVFDLGYDGEIHGYFDNNKNSYKRTENTKNERIGKKYQWIAFYEILGILTDNYKIRDRYSMNKKSYIYNGPWEITYRDIDPSFTAKRDVEENGEDDFGLLQEEAEWFSPIMYPHWNNVHDDWAETTADLPNPLECVEVTDHKGIKWLYLHSSYTWKAPKNVGESGFGAGRKEIWFMFQSFLVPKKKYNKTLEWLRSKEFSGRWLPESHDISNLFARECYWSPLSKEYEKERGKWEILDGSNLKVMLPSVQAIGSLDKDASGAHFGYHIPNKKIFDYLGLSYADLDGEFKDVGDEILFSNVSPLGPMIRKDALQKFLDENDMRIIWTLLGEKNSFYDSGGAEDIRKCLSGVFTMVGDTLEGLTIKVTDW